MSLLAHAAVQAYDIPRMDSIKIDGDPGDWADGGLHVDQLIDVNGAMPAPGDFDARARLGWNESGLLAMVQVTDTKAHEVADPGAMYTADSVEFFVGPSRGVHEMVQVIVGPTFDPVFPDVRTQIFDHRTAKNATPDATAIVQSSKTQNGYVVEMLFPWANLHMTPRDGSTLAFQMNVNDSFDGGLRHLYWYPSSGVFYDDDNAYNMLRLAGKPSPTISAVAQGSYLRFRWAKVAVTGRSTLSGSTVTIASGGAEVGRGTLKQNGSFATGTVIVPISAIKQPSDPLTVAIDKHRLQDVDLPDLAQAKDEQFDRERLAFTPFVFTGTDFPSVDFANPSLVEDLIGPYTLTTSFYDNEYRPVTQAAKPGRYGAVVDVATANGRHFTRYATLFKRLSGVRRGGMMGGPTIKFPDTVTAATGIPADLATANASGVDRVLSRVFLRETDASEDVARMYGALYEDSHGDGRVRTGDASDAWIYGLKKSLGAAPKYNYFTVLPDGYAGDTRHWPLVLFLHGSDSGTDREVVERHAFPMRAVQGDKFPFILVSPRSPGHEGWNPAELSDLLDEVEAKYRVDTERVYVTGLSMGGFGTYNLAMYEPNRFAAIAPVCGGSADTDFGYRLKDLPVWAFHGADDGNVPIAYDQQIVDAVKAAGGNVKFTIYPNTGHDAWTQAYAGDAMYTWLLAQRRTAAAATAP